jgi:site-specific DNA recombinase
MQAAIYARSSKDRSDVSIASQRRELQTLAQSKGLSIVEAFEDAVESGQSEDRPAFQDLARAIKNRNRGWTHLLCLDTSRLARNRYVAQWIKRECQRHGVEILYAKLPETDPVTSILLESVFEGIDEWHSAMSREKGLAGMRENVRNGWRAGGRAPTGYALKHEPTGAVREGVPVMKSKLVRSAEATTIGDYLQQRSKGIPRAKLMRDMSLTWPATTLIDIEWNALVYAGHTVWNRHTEKKSRGNGRARRRPRAQWLIERDTHEALITEAQAEAILAQLETSHIGQAVSRAKSAVGGYLLSGLLYTGDGRKWVGAGPYYRLKASEGHRGRKVSREETDQAVLAQITSDMRSPTFLQDLAESARSAGITTDPLAPLRAEVAKLEREKERAARLALATEDGGSFVRLVEDRTRQIAALQREIAARAVEESGIEMMRSLSPARIKELMLEVGSATAVLHTFVDRILLEIDGTLVIHYRAFQSRCLSMASPGGFGGWTLARKVSGPV